MISHVSFGGRRVVRWSWINFQVRSVLLVWIRVGQGPTALAGVAGGDCLDIFTLICPFSFLSPSLWETTRYRLKYCLKGSLSPKTTNHPTCLIPDVFSSALSLVVPIDIKLLIFLRCTLYCVYILDILASFCVFIS